MSAVVREPLVGAVVITGGIPAAVGASDSALTRVTQGLSLATLAIAPVFLVVSGDPSRWKRGVIVQLVDVLLVVLAIVGAAGIVRESVRDRRSPTAALLAVFAALSVAFVVHPSTTGMMVLLRFAGAMTLAHTLADASPSLRSRAARVWLAWTFIEALIAVLQVSLGRSIGVPGEVGIPFEELGGFKVPTGTSYGPHPIAAMGLVGIGVAVFGLHHRLVSKRWASLGASGGAVIVGVTCGTAGAISLTALLAAASIRAVRLRPSRDHASVVPVLLVVAVSFGLAAGMSLDGWRFKAERSATTDVVAASNGRAGMIDEAVAMIKRWPLLGVGPGRFMATRDANPEIKALASEDQQVHNVALLIVTESGVLGAAALATLALSMVRRMRGQPYAITLLVAMIGHVLFDHAPWTFGFGMVQLAIVLGFAAAKTDPTGVEQSTQKS